MVLRLVAKDCAGLDEARLARLAEWPLFACGTGERLPLPVKAKRFSRPKSESSSESDRAKDPCASSELLEPPSSTLQELYDLLEIRPLPRSQHWAAILGSTERWRALSALNRVATLRNLRRDLELIKSEPLEDGVLFGVWLSKQPVLWGDSDEGTVWFSPRAALDPTEPLHREFAPQWLVPTELKCEAIDSVEQPDEDEDWMPFLSRLGVRRGVSRDDLRSSRAAI